MKLIFSEMYSQLDDFFREVAIYAKDATSVFPKINAWLEKDTNQIIIEASLSGYKKDDVDISIDTTNSFIIFKATKQNKEVEDKRHYFLRELKTSAFERKLRIPNTVKLDKCETAYQDGIVTMTFPLKTDEEMGKRKVTF